jgi:hypothetical protein
MAETTLIMPRLLGALIGRDMFDERRRELESEEVRLQSQIRAAALSVLSSRYPNEDPEELLTKHSKVVEEVEKEVGAHYRALMRQKLDILGRMEERLCGPSETTRIHREARDVVKTAI